MNQPIYIFVTGGVASSLGKGIIAASIGRLLLARGYKITIQKFDPYINIDPGTLNPYEHGECYVTTDGCETDLDLGHYERFTDIRTTSANNVTTGKIYQTVIERERKGEYLGRTVQVVPHITDEIKRRMLPQGLLYYFIHFEIVSDKIEPAKKLKNHGFSPEKYPKNFYRKFSAILVGGGGAQIALIIYYTLL